MKCSDLSFLFSHRSENSKSEVSIDEEIEEVSIEGPDISDKVSLSPSSIFVLTLHLKPCFKRILNEYGS